MKTNKYIFRVKALDLHGVKHANVVMKLENYVFRTHHQGYFPVKIITGNSDTMKKIVIDFLKENKYKYEIGDKYNKGYIVVTK